VDAFEFTQELKLPAAVLAGEGGKFGKFRSGFAEEGAHPEAGLPRGATMKAVVTDAGEAFRQDVEEPAANEFVRSLKGPRAVTYSSASGVISWSLSC
jgi:hypothetical protein